MKRVTTKRSEKSLKTVAMVTKILPLIPKLKIIIIPLKKQQKIRNTGSIKMKNEKEMNFKSTSLFTSWVAEYEMQLDPCDYPLY